MAAATIQVTPDDYIATHEPLVYLLKAVEKAGIGGIATTNLCDIVFNSRRKGMDVIRQAENMGYIHRFKVPKGRVNKKKAHKPGPHYYMNALTPTGRQLLSQLDSD